MWPPPWRGGWALARDWLLGRQSLPQVAPWSSVTPGLPHAFEDGGRTSLQKATSRLEPGLSPCFPLVCCCIYKSLALLAARFVSRGRRHLKGQTLCRWKGDRWAGLG